MPYFNVSVIYYGTIVVEAATANEAEKLVREYDLSDAEINDVSFGEAFISDNQKENKKVNNGTHT